MNRGATLVPAGAPHPCRAISRADLEVFLHEADRAAAKLVRRFRLSIHDREDLCQDLLADLIGRFRWFDPSRGTLGAFAGTIVQHRATRLANRIRRERTTFTQFSVSTLSRDHDEEISGDVIAETEGYAAIFAEISDRFVAVERRLDLGRALTKLEPDDLRLCVELINRTPNEISRSGPRSRAGIYRQIKEIRLRMSMTGISAGS
jgi:RNA polymerase sigma factor (sigma-70 family)